MKRISKGFYQKHYVPSEDITRFFAERLRLERLTLLKEAAETKLSKDEDRLLRRLRTAKSRLLDKVSQEIVDLVFFFESIAAHKELQDIFENDLKELLGVKEYLLVATDPLDGREYRPYFHPETFKRLVSAILTIYAGNDNSYRLVLTDSLQELINDKLRNQKRPDMTEEISNIMLSDIQRAQVWTKLYASGIKKDATQYHRAIGYSLRTIYTPRSYESELESHSKIF